MIKRAIFFGLLGTLILFSIYLTVLTLVSGWQFTLRQFSAYWYFILSLSFGFGIQIGLYAYLKTAIKTNNQSSKVVAVSGTTSTIAMISCCSHYLVNLLPIIGITGFIALLSQYQIQLFWVGIAANLIGTVYIGRKVVRLKKWRKFHLRMP